MRKKIITLEELKEELKDYTLYALEYECYPDDKIEPFITSYYLVFCKYAVEECFPERLTLWEGGNTFKISGIDKVERLKSKAECKYRLHCTSPTTHEEKWFTLKVI